MRANSWQDIADLSASLGVQLDAWQELIIESAMGERSDHTWAAKRVGISVPRQNGKSQLLVARALAGALLFGEKKIVVSAHQQDTAREAFAKLMEIIEDDGNSQLRSRLDARFGRSGVMNAINREAVGFANGAKIQFKARSGAAGKGFSSDCLLLDEAQILGSRAWTSINSTMSAMPNPQVWLLGTPPQEEDDCYAFDMVRRAALDGKSTAATWCEWSADPTADDFDPASEYTRWTANPAWNARINHEVVQGEYETYSPDRFAQDRLGIWRSSMRRSIFPAWPDLVREPPAPLEVLALGVATDNDQTILSLGAACKGVDHPHLAITDRRSAADRRGFASNVARIQRERKCPVLIRGKNFMVADLTEAGVDLTLVDADQRAQAHTDLETAIQNGELEHGGYPELDAAVEVANWAVRDNRRNLDSRKGEISALESVAFALRGSTVPTTIDAWGFYE